MIDPNVTKSQHIRRVVHLFKKVVCEVLGQRLMINVPPGVEDYALGTNLLVDAPKAQDVGSICNLFGHQIQDQNLFLKISPHVDSN